MAIVIIAVIIFTYFFIKNTYKNSDFGNTIDKSVEGITQYLLNISSYEAEIEVTITSNKNTNKYKIKQSYAQPNVYRQEVIEPSNIQGVTITYDGKDLRIENTRLSLSQIYENYPYLDGNELCLSAFLNEYKDNQNKEVYEENNQIIMKIKTDSKYQAYKMLYIDKKTAKPIKMEIQDMNQKMLVYILYNEIKMNSTNKEEILAFQLLPTKEEI